MSYIYDARGKPFVPHSGRPKCWDNFCRTTKPRLLGATRPLHYELGLPTVLEWPGQSRNWPVVPCPGLTRICTGIVCNCQLALVTSSQLIVQANSWTILMLAPLNVTVSKALSVFSLTVEKIGVTPSVAAPGDTHPSDATVCDRQYVLECTILQLKSHKFSGGIAPGPPCRGGDTAPLSRPHPSALRCFAPPAPRSWPSASQLYIYVPEWRNQKLATLLWVLSRLFLSCRSWSTVGRLPPTSPFSDSAWWMWTVLQVCQCMVYTD